MRQLKINKQITNREIASLDKYLQEVSKIEMIDSNQEIELARRIHIGDKSALEKLIRANLRFVISVSKQYQNQGLSLPDLINEGNLGLMKAAQRYDETKGFKFISYAVWWIRQSILQALAEQSRIVRLPLNKIGAIHKINRAHIHLEQENQRTPSAEELAEVLDMTEEEIKVCIRNTGKHISMDAPLVEDEDINLYDVLSSSNSSSPDKDLIVESLKIEIERVLKTLTSKEADIIRLYYGLNKKNPSSLEEISKNFNLTKERVRQIKEKAIKKLKQNFRRQLLQSYLNK